MSCVLWVVWQQFWTLTHTLMNVCVLWVLWQQFRTLTHAWTNVCVLWLQWQQFQTLTHTHTNVCVLWVVWEQLQTLTHPYKWPCYEQHRKRLHLWETHISQRTSTGKQITKQWTCTCPVVIKFSHIMKSDQHKLDRKTFHSFPIATHKSYIPPHTGIQMAAFYIETSFQTTALKNQDI